MEMKYKKISELEEITEVSENSYLPVLDNGAMKKISASGLNTTGGSAAGGSKPVVFFVSSSTLYKDKSYSTAATAEDVVDAYMAGSAFVRVGNDYVANKITAFNISTGLGSAWPVWQSSGSTYSDQIYFNLNEISNAMQKYF